MAELIDVDVDVGIILIVEEEFECTEFSVFELIDCEVIKLLEDDKSLTCDRLGVGIVWTVEETFECTEFIVFEPWNEVINSDGIELIEHWNEVFDCDGIGNCCWYCCCGIGGGNGFWYW